MSKKYIVGIPCLYGPDHCKAAIESASVKYADVLVIDNGADADVKQVIKNSNAYVISNAVNKFVNPAWNQILEFFLANEQYDVVCIMNSDVVLPTNYIETLNKFYEKYPNDIPLPVEGTAYPDGSGLTVQKVDGGIAGTFICLTRPQVKNVYPIPEQIKVWFGENYIWDTHRQIGVTTYLVHELKIQHGNSRTVSIVPGISEIIEQDKIAWANVVEPKMRELIEKLKLNL